MIVAAVYARVRDPDLHATACFVPDRPLVSFDPNSAVLFCYDTADYTDFVFTTLTRSTSLYFITVPLCLCQYACRHV